MSVNNLSIFSILDIFYARDRGSSHQGECILVVVVVFVLTFVKIEEAIKNSSKQMKLVWQLVRFGIL